MFFLNGLKNIKIILIVSIIIFLITSILINLNLKKTKNAEIAFVCSDHYSFGKTETEDHARMKESHIYLNFCNNFKSYIDKKYENLNGVSKNLKFTFIEPDNYSYLNSLAKLNEITFAKEKILSILKRNNIDTVSLLNSISYSISKPDFMSVDNGIFDEEIKKLKTLEFLKKHHINNIEFVTIFSNLYTFVFNDNNKIEFFLFSINFITLIILSLFIFYFFKQFILNNNKLIPLVVLFTILNPVNIYYFLSFFKEPFILIFFLGLIVNVIYLNNNYKHRYVALIVSFFFLVFLFLIILELKDVYLLPSLSGLIICYILLLYKRKDLLFSFICIIKIIILTFFLLDINTYYQLSPHNISNERLEQFFINKLPEKKSEVKNVNKTQKEKFFRSETVIKNEIKKGNEEFIKKSIEVKGYQHYDCKNEILKIICKKINSLTFRISNLKLATLHEIKDANKESIIVGYKFNGASDVLKNIPIAFIKSHFMPFNVNSNINTAISFYKIILIIFTIFFIFKLIRSEKIFFVFISILIFLPLLTVIDLITSNFFTYFRYVLPYNLILSMIAILGFLTIFKENDKYFY